MEIDLTTHSAIERYFQFRVFEADLPGGGTERVPLICEEFGTPLTWEQIEPLVDLFNRAFGAYATITSEAIAETAGRMERERQEEIANRGRERDRRARRRGVRGYVYLAWCETGDHKIGRSKRPGERIKVFNTSMPLTVEVVHTFEADDYKAAESLLHQTFAEKRIEGGEWFKLDEADVAWIKEITHYEDGRLWRAAVTEAATEAAGATNDR